MPFRRRSSGTMDRDPSGGGPASHVRRSAPIAPGNAGRAGGEARRPCRVRRRRWCARSTGPGGSRDGGSSTRNQARVRFIGKSPSDRYRAGPGAQFVFALHDAETASDDGSGPVMVTANRIAVFSRAATLFVSSRLRHFVVRPRRRAGPGGTGVLPCYRVRPQRQSHEVGAEAGSCTALSYEDGNASFATRARNSPARRANGYASSYREILTG